MEFLKGQPRDPQEEAMQVPTCQAIGLAHYAFFEMAALREKTPAELYQGELLRG